MKTPATKLNDLMEDWRKTAIMAGVTVEIKDGSFVIESEKSQTMTLPKTVSSIDLNHAFIAVVRAQREEYRGYTIEPKLDFGTHAHLCNGAKYKTGWVVVKDGCNAMPGAVWFTLRRKARHAIDALIDVDGDAGEFWKRVRAA